MIVRADSISIRRAAERLRDGELVAFPTETVYGLGARADVGAAVRKIYEAKSRPATNPSIVHVASVEQARALTTDWSELAEELAARFWPGPLTLVLPVRPGAIAPETLAGGSSIAIRIPAQTVALELLRLAEVPVAAPSANRSNHLSPTTAEHVARSLGEDVFILDGGPANVGIESTIVEVCPFRVLRRGGISAAELATFGAIEDVGDEVDSPTKTRAPGRMKRHYAPAHPTSLSPALALRAGSSRDGYLVLAAEPPSGAHAIRLPENPVDYARGLYGALHELDARDIDAIRIEAPPSGPAWAAVWDRLRRATTEEP